MYSGSQSGHPDRASGGGCGAQTEPDDSGRGVAGHDRPRQRGAGTVPAGRQRPDVREHPADSGQSGESDELALREEQETHLPQLISSTIRVPCLFCTLCTVTCRPKFHTNELLNFTELTMFLISQMRK